MSMRISLTLLAAAAVASLAACSSVSPTKPQASAELQATRGNNAKGTVRFMQTADNTLLVTGEISGLKPNSEHGFHIHEKGDCSSGDGMSAGGHFNPTGSAHGKFDADAHHGGDLPSLRADANGVARFNTELKGISLAQGAANNVVGRGLIVHADPDDYKTQPTGNAGARLACAVIK
ncbi:superoxide dismutase family protein [Diaphorobacter ruginosibacter]|uniref:Superoxide dismutase [Cu-Zn] n=1 Tax=Diaphorobacter ruginosibacter TaxID=1715720 RepID=A0A7G9RUI2_9BURK|nr:superoxide dismutase family protein [Diaphorobacter ruginosibacter]QNN59257.1 superoxide dismutase family protein [Diaphorobacter ruginosibacter]